MSDDTPFVNKVYGFSDRVVNPNHWGNDFIRNNLLKNKPFAAAKIGGIECSALQEFFRKDDLSDWFKQMHWTTLADAMFNNAGIYPKTEEDMLNWAEIFSSSLKEIDLLAVWNPQYDEDLIIANWAQNSHLTTMRALEPFYHTNSWSDALEGKKVLVISPFTETITSQYKNKHDVWPPNGDFTLPDFDLQTLRCPLSPALVRPEHKSWSTALNSMCEKISNIDFDVALIGAGAYSIPLCSFIKEIHRSSIHIGGGLQILFGVKGSRWANHEIINTFFNNHWVYPSAKETPGDTSLIEGSCYWAKK